MINLAVIFGGKSTEHDVSITSGTSVIKNLNKQKYNIFPIYIDEEGNWYRYTKNINEIDIVAVGTKINELEKIENVIEYLKNMDCIFPVLHGLYGEDGTIQGLFELIGIPYVGCGVLSSSISMDKAYTKILFDKANINQADYLYIKKVDNKYVYIDKNFNEMSYEIKELIKMAEEKLKYPMFVKPSNSGSSVGVNKANNSKELQEAIICAEDFDSKILIEQGIDGREIECAVFGKQEIMASCVGEVLSAEEFYSFDSKYKNSESKTQIPAKIDEKISDEIRNLAKKIFKIVDGKGLSRVDFFVERNTNKIYINEINTMPGFTEISMYPKLFEASGIEYTDILDKLIEIAMD